MLNYPPVVPYYHSLRALLLTVRVLVIFSKVIIVFLITIILALQTSQRISIIPRVPSFSFCLYYYLELFLFLFWYDLTRIPVNNKEKMKFMTLKEFVKFFVMIATLYASTINNRKTIRFLEHCIENNHFFL